MLPHALQRAIVAWPANRELDNVDVAFLGRAKKGDPLPVDLGLMVKLIQAGLVERTGRTACRSFVTCRLTAQGKAVAAKFGGQVHD